MDSDSYPPTKALTTRYKCYACYKQYKKKEHLVEHMKISYHSAHQPRCAVCQKHCKSFESLREHLTGPLAKTNCLGIFSDRGCDLCLEVFDSPSSLNKHREMCCLSAPASLATEIPTCTESQIYVSGSIDESYACKGGEAVAIDCEMVGGGSDGSLDLCARVCLLDEDENIIFHSYVQPQIPVTNYRDTAKYRPLMKTNLVSHSLKYLVQTYLGYNIQTGVHDPYEDCVSVMRLYKRMRAQNHHVEGSGIQSICGGFDFWKPKELEKMTPEKLYEISRSNYRCWCLDLKGQQPGLI
ncbi:uncharacterized protein LOC110614820 isoform X2 [Manihot esculenta]|uniref:C2H2-type domain-containing protein n=1 Tax=Manihot esculenta TaxID=3983 RepID=A0A2C9VWA9_MANES|nr:uncharacterized protein LOC110614820 isoform X2 [Manihot esculenta]OAY49663.1 hypothetical protein MANES_05G073200v8 [Manihot esculenta]